MYGYILLLYNKSRRKNEVKAVLILPLQTHEILLFKQQILLTYQLIQFKDKPK